LRTRLIAVLLAAEATDQPVERNIPPWPTRRKPGECAHHVRTAMSVEENRTLVQRLVDEVVNAGDEAALYDLATGAVAEAARRWIGPFREAFPDFQMQIVRLVAEGDAVAAHFKCSGTHRGEWQGRAPTGRRFEGVDEIYIFEIRDGRLRSAVAVEDNFTRMRQLGFDL
jgi:predicted ester cyclase